MKIIIKKTENIQTERQLSRDSRKHRKTDGLKQQVRKKETRIERRTKTHRNGKTCKHTDILAYRQPKKAKEMGRKKGQTIYL